MFELPAAVAITDDYISSHTEIAGHTGHLYLLPAPLALHPPMQDFKPFEEPSKENAFEEHATLPAVGRKRWVIFEFFGMAHADSVFAQLTQLDCDIVGVGHIDGEQMTAFCRRSPTRKFVLTGGIAVGKTLTLNVNHGGRNTQHVSERVIQTVRAWASLCKLVHSNFDIKNTGGTTTLRNVLREWQGLSSAEINLEIGEAKAKSSKKRTAREALIVNTKSELLAAMRAGSEGVSTIRFDAGDNHVNLSSLVPPPSQLTLRSYNVLTGALVEVSLKEWIMGGLFSQRSLVIHGDAQCAKTPVARAVCAFLATNLQRESGNDPFYLKVGTADSLRDATRDGQMRPGVPILFDEVSPSAPRGSRQAMGIEDVKHMTEAAETSSLDSRFKDIVFAYPQPKIFTSNAATPHEWFHDLPPDVFVQTDAQRLALHANVAAVFKRCFFLHVNHCMIPQSVRDSFDAEKLASLSAQMAQFIGPDMA